MALTGTPAAAPAATPAAGSPADFKAQKAAAAKRHAEKVKAAKESDHQLALKTRDALQKFGTFDKLDEDVKKWLLAKCVPVAERAAATGGPSFFSQVFGENPAIGKVVTLNDVIKATYKGMDTMRAQIKKWAGKGIEVKTDINQTDMLQTKYTLVKLA